MTYHIDIDGMHCNGCKNLISTELDDRGFADVKIDLDAKSGTFSTDLGPDAVSQTIAAAEGELGRFRFLNLRTV